MMIALEGGARAAQGAAGVPTLRWHDYSTQLKISQMETDQTGFDTIILGTSMAQQGLVPNAFIDRSVYNAGLNGGVPAVMEPWLRDHVLARVGEAKAPTTVIWGLSSIDFSASYGDATINAYSQSPSAENGLLPAIDRATSSKLQFVANRSILRNPSAMAGGERQKNITKYEAASSTLGANGERRDFTESISIERGNEVRQRIAPYTLDVEDIAAVVRTIEDLQALDTEVVLVELPVPPRFLELYESQQSHRGFQQALSALSSELNVELISVSDTYSNEDFVDFTHLNEASAHRLTKAIDAQLG